MKELFRTDDLIIVELSKQKRTLTALRQRVRAEIPEAIVVASRSRMSFCLPDEDFDVRHPDRPTLQAPHLRNVFLYGWTCLGEYDGPDDLEQGLHEQLSLFYQRPFESIPSNVMLTEKVGRQSGRFSLNDAIIVAADRHRSALAVREPAYIAVEGCWQDDLKRQLLYARLHETPPELKREQKLLSIFSQHRETFLRFGQEVHINEAEYRVFEV